MLTTQSTVTQRLLGTKELLVNSTISLTTTGPLQTWIHPNLTQSVNPNKGRQLQASGLIRKGEHVLIDTPYAIIPVPDADSPQSTIICSNSQCNRPVPCNSGLPCPHHCIADVAWCNHTCRDLGHQRHEFECAWLKRYATSLRSKRGEYNFGMLWLIVRVLAARHIESQPSGSDVFTDLLHPLFKGGWEAIQSLCGSPETWSHAQVREWSALVKKYLGGTSIPHDMKQDEVLALICREEANSFGLYPRETGIYPSPNPPINRGEQFGAAVYPRASIANHSCHPNIIHKPDNSGRMVFTAARDIKAGEECCISYFDMTQYVGLRDRREHLRTLFRFICGCARCSEEDIPEQEGSQWDVLPGLEF